MQIVENCTVWPPKTPEGQARFALKFVRVSTVDGHLTDISIAMILVELKRQGVRLSLDHLPQSTLT
jgi:hypothetical protein